MTDFERRDKEAGALRSAIFPVVTLPRRGMEVVGYVLVASGLVDVAAGIVRAVSYPFPGAGGASSFVEVTQRLALVDRIQLLASGASAFTAILLLLGAVGLVMAASAGDEDDRRRRAWLVAAGAGAAIVLAANVALAVAILANVNGTFVHAGVDRFATLIQLLAPIALAGGVLFLLWIGLSSEP